jgi:Gas vesicle protein
MRRRARIRSPRSSPKPSTVTRKTSHSTVPDDVLEAIAKPPRPARRPPRPPKPVLPPKRQVARIVDDEDASLVDLIDNLLAKGVMLNADLILALANVDLVYVRLSALLCAADRVLGPVAPKPRRGEGA